MSKLETNTIDTVSGTSTLQVGSTNTSTITLGVSGDTINVPSGVTINNNGTQTGFGGTNTPAFHARANSAVSTTDNVETKVTFGAEDFDTDSAYDTSTSKFTVPSGKAGKYFIYSMIRVDSATDSEIYDIKIKKNGSEVLNYAANQYRYTSASVSATLDLAVSDYLEVYVLISNNLSLRNDQKECYFGGYKLVE